MNEAEYINVADLARIRAALLILGQCVDSSEKLSNATKSLHELKTELANHVEIFESDETAEAARPTEKRPSLVSTRLAAAFECIKIKMPVLYRHIAARNGEVSEGVKNHIVDIERSLFAALREFEDSE